MEVKSKVKISYVLQALYIIPFILFAILFMALTTYQFSNVLYSQVENDLKNCAGVLITNIDNTYPGDYTLVGENALKLYKGETDITNSYSLVDDFKKTTGMDATLFYRDTRILTTVYQNDSTRIVGSGAPKVIVQDVLNSGEAHFYMNALVNKEEFFAYYTPLRNSDGSIAGMLFVGKPTALVKQQLRESLYPLYGSAIVVLICIGVLLGLYTSRFTKVLLKIRAFLQEVSAGNLDAQLDSSVIGRKDEFGDIGRSAINTQQSLRRMIEMDTLTELYNRRFADRKMEQVAKKAGMSQTPFSIAIGDIDFFKKVNDTYGHDCGDLVLKQVAATLRDHMYSHGFVARWGGEEFLFVFNQMNMQEAEVSLNQLLDKIRAMNIQYKDQVIKVTMTFGVTDNFTGEINHLVKAADDKLYAGKTGGRNRVIV